jgi:uncharacterized protein YciI
MPVFAVIYHYDPARHDLRMERRPEHRVFLDSLESDGVLLAGGAWADDGAPGGLLVARGADMTSVTAIFDRDPYHRLGVLAGREIREWTQLLGPWREAR